MYNFKATINGILFTQADFEGMAYLDGVPDSLEAMGDETITDSVGSWPTATGTVDITDVGASVTLTWVPGVSKSVPVGSFVIIYGATSSAGAVVRAVSPTTVTLTILFPGPGPSIVTGTWTIIRTKARLRTEKANALGLEGYGGPTPSKSGLLLGSMRNLITLNSAASAAYGTPTPAGWTYYGPLKDDPIAVTPLIDGGVNIQSVIGSPGSSSAMIYGDSNSLLRPFAYGTCIIKMRHWSLNPSNPDSWVGLVSSASSHPTPLIRVTRNSVISTGIPAVSKPAPDQEVIFIFHPHVRMVEAWNGGVLLGRTQVTPDVTGLMAFRHMQTSSAQDEVFNFTYVQQVWR